MLEKQYWGTRGQYGPFTPQADGWPNRGEVVRTYRKQQKMSAKRLAELYGDAIGNPVKERWIQMMEKDNMVPKDDSRRQALAKILGIPPVLLGLGALKDLLPQETLAQNTKLTGFAKNGHDILLKHYDTFLTVYWRLDYSSTAHESLVHIEGIINDLREYIPLVSGIEQTQAIELLLGFYPLSSTIYSDQRNYSKAEVHATSAVTLAESLENNRLLALARYQLGWVKLQQGIAMTGSQGTMSQQRLVAAIADFESARPLASPQVEASILLDLGWAYSLKKGGGNADAKTALNYIDTAETIVGRGRFVDGTFLDVYANMNKGKCLLGRAIALTGIGHFDAASDELEDAEKIIPHDQTRRRAYIDMLWSHVYIGQRSYALATEHALSAAAQSQSIHSSATTAQLRRIQTQLLETNYGTSLSVRELGAALILP